MAPTSASPTQADDLRRQGIDPARLAGLVTLAAPRETRTVHSPLDGSALGDVPVGTPDDVALAARIARAAQPAWAATPLARRCSIASRFRDLVLSRQAKLLAVMHAENGKSRLNAFEELLDTALTAGYYATNAERHLAPHRRSGAIPGLTTAYETWQPKGVVGIISPWNYPLTLAASDAIPALLAGNAVVLKPDSATPFTALAALDLLRQAGLPHDVMQIVTGPGASLGTPLIDAVDYLMFTGSTATGRVVAAQCAERLIGCSAELGGKNPMLVLEDADLDVTVEGAVQACFSTTGQLCVSVERIYVHVSLYDTFCRRFAERTRRIVLGRGAGWGVDLGPLHDQAQFDKVVAHVDDAVAKGATVLAGGRPRPDLGAFFYEPTVLVGVTEPMTAHRTETFGPVVAVYPVADDAAAIAAANDTAYGLNASVWSADPAHALAVAARLRAGTVNINEGYAAAWASHDAPMGGMGISGMGRRHGAEGIRKYTEPQTIAAQRGLPLGPPGGVPRAGYAATMTLGGRVLHRLPLSRPAAWLRPLVDRRAAFLGR
ncbi:MAG: succinic semialdehyde dehydrogenase [Actinomycetia bacterium]|nr:succinic semialdehyde dehydrogenase [Actinomycetes bacterium]